jgi:hypothetical protein
VDRLDPLYILNLQNDIFNFFLAGLHEQYRARVLGVPNPPQTLAEVIPILRAAEAELKSKGSVNLLNVTTELSDLQINQIRNAGKSPNQRANSSPGSQSKGFQGYCHNCSLYGHSSRKCTKPIDFDTTKRDEYLASKRSIGNQGQNTKLSTPQGGRPNRPNRSVRNLDVKESNTQEEEQNDQGALWGPAPQ